MTKGVILPLDSYQLIQCAAPIACYVCEAENTQEAEFCSRCSAPMALAHQATRQNICPRMIAALGASGAGKTVYLGMLMDLLSRHSDQLQLLARGAFSISLQQTTIAALARSEFPAKTSNEPDRWNWVHCQIRRGKKRPITELIVPDLAGESLFEEIEHPHSFRVIGAFLRKCLGAMVLIDAIKLRGGRDQDYFTMKLLSYLGELEDPRGERTWRKKPIAMIFTKADQCPECIADPEGYARQQAAGLYQHCRERFSDYRFFAAGVAGACAQLETRNGRVQVPLRIEPRGIVEPFVWLLERTRQ
jgi:hypothetical protein